MEQPRALCGALRARLRLLIEADQSPWCPELDGDVRVSSLQIGVFTGPVDSKVGPHRFAPAAVVREAQENVQLYTPLYGRIEMRARATDNPRCMAALWMIGYEDEPERSAEICVCEIFGRAVAADQVAVGMGVHPFGDPRISDEFASEAVPIDARDFHVYAAEWTPEYVEFSVEGEHVKTVGQSPSYPMQIMLSLYEFPEDGSGDGSTPRPYPKEFVVDYVRGYRRTPAQASDFPHPLFTEVLERVVLRTSHGPGLALRDGDVAGLGGDPLQPGSHCRESFELEASLGGDMRVGVEGYVRH